MERIRNVVRATSRETGRNLRAITPDELGGEIVPKVNARCDRDRPVGVGSVADDLGSIRQHAGAGKIFAEQIAHVRVVVVKGAIAQGMSEDRGGEIIPLYFDLEDAAVRAVFGLDLHG